MPTKREAVLAALAETIEAVTVDAVPIVFRRNDTSIERLADGSLPKVMMFDGEPGEPEVTLSPLTFIYNHRVELEVYCSGDGDGCGARLDNTLAAIGAAIAVDRTLGGLADWTMPDAPVVQDMTESGSAGLRAATVAVMVIYGTTDPLA